MAELDSVTDAVFDEVVLKSDVPVLVDFWAAWCGPCRQLHPILEQIAEEKGDAIKIVKMNADENPLTPAQYRVIGLPTMNLYSKGELVWSATGVRPKSAILSDLEQHL